MVAIKFIATDGTDQLIHAEEGSSLMESAVGNGIEVIEAQCGRMPTAGPAGCTLIRRGALSGEVTEVEVAMIEVSGDMTHGVRVSCQITVTPSIEGLIVRTPVSQS